MEDIETRKARSVYRKLAEAVEKNGWKCKTNDGKLAVAYGIKSEGLDTVRFVAYVDAERSLICVNSLPIMNFGAERVREGAKAVCVANCFLADGSFDLKIKGGELSFRQAASFRGDTNLSVEAIAYLLNYSLYAVSSFFDKFKLVNEGKLDGSNFYSACESLK